MILSKIEGFFSHQQKRGRRFGFPKRRRMSITGTYKLALVPNTGMNDLADVPGADGLTGCGLALLLVAV